MLSHSKMLIIMGLALFLLAFPCTSMASASKEIDRVTIHIISNKASDDSEVDVDVTTDANKYYVDKVSVIYSSDDKRIDEDQPILKVYLKVNDDYIFAHEVSEKGSFSGMKGSLLSGRLSETQLISYVVLDVQKDDDYYDIYARNLDVGNLIWDEENGTARWKGNANNYQVKLCRGGKWITSLSTQNRSCDLSSYITDDGYYTFQVRAESESHKGNWKKSHTWRVTYDEAMENFNKSVDRQIGPGISNSKGSWLKDNTGWRYRNADGSNAASNWQYINDNWYYFHESGYMETGWIKWKSNWYYCGDDGAMDTNTTTPDGYHVGNDGAWTGS